MLTKRKNVIERLTYYKNLILSTTDLNLIAKSLSKVIDIGYTFQAIPHIVQGTDRNIEAKRLVLNILRNELAAVENNEWDMETIHFQSACSILMLSLKYTTGGIDSLAA